MGDLCRIRCNYHAKRGVQMAGMIFQTLSRSRKRLVLFITVPVEGDFMIYLKKLFGVENICTYSEFISMDK